MTKPPEIIRPWPSVANRKLGDHRIFSLWETVRQRPDTGTEHLFLGLKAPDWVNVIVVTEECRIVLVEQYRHGTDSVTLEIPGGAVDPGETPLDAGVRELEEETGYIGEQHQIIGCVEPNPAFLDNRCWTVLSLGCRPQGRLSFDPGEQLRALVVRLSEFTGLIDRGEIRHALVVSAHDHLMRGIAGGAPWAAGLRE